MFITEIKYKEIETEKYRLYYNDFVIYRELTAGEESVRRFAIDFETNSHNFDLFLGSFRIIMHCKNSDEYIFFADNQNSQLFFYDKLKGIFSDSLIKVNNLEPNLKSIAQFLNFGYIYSYETICENVYSTNPNCFYTLSSNGIHEHSKNLTPLGTTVKYNSIEEIANVILNSTKHLKKINIITGGVDSRMILANIYKLGGCENLVISGDENHVDVKIAKEISKTLGNLPLIITPDEANDELFIANIFHESDGQVGISAVNRLLNKAKILNSKGFDLEFGGVAGEIYKNSFINQQFPNYKKSLDLEQLYNIKIFPYKSLSNIFSDSINSQFATAKKDVISTFSELHGEEINTGNYFDIAYFIMQKRIMSLSNSLSKYIKTSSILMERDIVSLMYGKNPYKLEMARFQRNEISKQLPIIAKVKTDRNTTASNNSLYIFSELIKNYVFMCKLFVQRKFFKTVVTARKDATFDSMKNSQEVKNAILTCKRIDILNKNTEIDDIPDTQIDRILTLGMFFDKN